MQRLRHARFLVRLVLAWFVVSLGVAVASPVVQPRGLDFICSSGVLQLLPGASDADRDGGRGLSDCPLCIQASAPPPPLHVLPVVSQRTAGLSAPSVHDQPARRIVLPPARGPPGL